MIINNNNDDNYEIKEVFCKYITKNGKMIHPRSAEFFHFFIKVKNKL